MDRDTAVREVLMTAESYLKNTDRLIYSYAGKTYLSGAPILDRDFQNRGNIDCSTYVHLVLQGVPYEESPYVTGNAEDTFRSAAAWREAQFADAEPLCQTLLRRDRRTQAFLKLKNIQHKTGQT